MVTTINGYDYTCLSSDPKPDGLKNGAVLYEMDTQKVFMYDEENKTWIEQ